jgi:hypothetical protein
VVLFSYIGGEMKELFVGFAIGLVIGGGIFTIWYFYKEGL